MASEDLPTRIRFQIEYYFSPKNLLRPDKFILSRLRYEADGKVTIPLKTIADFKKVKELTEDLQTVVAALEGSEIMEVNTAGETPELLLKHIRPAERKTVTLRDVPADATEAQIRPVFGGAEPISVRSISTDVWHATFDTEVLAKQAADSADGAEVGGTAVSAKLKVEGPIYIRPEDAAASKAMKHKVSKKFFLPIAMRPLLIGHKGRNIRKLQEQIKSLEVDTNPDDPDNITVKADSEEHLAEAIDLIDKFFRPPEEGGSGEGAGLPQQQQQQLQQHQDADMPAWGGGGGPPPAPALPLSSGLPLYNQGMGGGGFPPGGVPGGAGGLPQNMLLQQQAGLGGLMMGQQPGNAQQMYMQNLQQIRLQQQFQQQQSTQALFRALQQNPHQLSHGGPPPALGLEQNLARMNLGGGVGGVPPFQGGGNSAREEVAVQRRDRRMSCEEE